MLTSVFGDELIAALTPDTLRWVLHDLRAEWDRGEPQSDALIKFRMAVARQLDVLTGEKAGA